jgi:hypothetical protein
MDARMQPRSDAYQRCLNFQLKIHPRARVHSYRVYLGNTVHHFDVPGNHRQLMLPAEALVEVQPNPVLPDSLGANAWAVLDAMIAGADYMEIGAMTTHFFLAIVRIETFNWNNAAKSA